MRMLRLLEPWKDRGRVGKALASISLRPSCEFRDLELEMVENIRCLSSSVKPNSGENLRLGELLALEQMVDWACWIQSLKIGEID